jgi:hypothetical protein
MPAFSLTLYFFSGFAKAAVELRLGTLKRRMHDIAA